jgi:hypothetical protein
MYYERSIHHGEQLELGAYSRRVIQGRASRARGHTRGQDRSLGRRRGEAEPLGFVGSFETGADPVALAADMRRQLGIGEDFSRVSKSWSDHVARLSRAADAAGILVFRSGIVGGNTRRPLSVDEFRGFALCDELAPVVFVNAADYKAAQSFTLAHGLAHLWIGKSGVSNETVDAFSRGYRSEREERGEESGGSFYNNFAARNGERFPSVILGALRGGRILYREAARLFDVQPRTV